jgi:hypothetical protein
LQGDSAWTTSAKKLRISSISLVPSASLAIRHYRANVIALVGGFAVEDGPRTLE